MEEFSIFLSAILFVLVVLQNRKIRKIRNRLDELSAIVREKSEPEGIPLQNESAVVPGGSVELRVMETPQTDEVPPAGREPAATESRPGRIALSPSKIPGFIDLLLKNWIGIIGTVVLVSGFGFLGTYVAFGLNEFGRFILFVSSSLLIAAGSLFLEKKLNLLKIALWLRSASGAVFLFACIGSSGIPGFKWVDNGLSGLLLLILGVAANLALAHVSGLQVIASVHVFLNLLAISLAPPALPPFLVALAVVLYGLFLTFRKKWDVNFLLILCLFFIYHLIWHFQSGQNGAGDIPMLHQASALFSVLLVFLLSLSAHYRHIYSQRSFERVPFMTHFLNWVFLGNGLFMYRDLIPLKFLLLAAGAGAAYIISRRAKKLEIRWLFITDALASNLLMILALAALSPHGVTWFYISIFIFFESLVFLAVTMIEKDGLLAKIAYFIVPAAGTATVVVAIALSDSYQNPWIPTAAMVGALLVSAALYFLFSRRNALLALVDQKMAGAVAFFMPLQVLTLFILLGDTDFAFMSVLFLIPLVYIKDRRRNPVLAVMVKAAASLSVLATLIYSESYAGRSIALRIAFLLPQALVFITMTRYSRIIIRTKKTGKGSDLRTSAFPLYWLNFFIIAQCLIFFQSRSSYAIGMIVFFLSIANLETGRMLPSIGRTQRHIAFIEMALFFAIHLAVNRGLEGHLLLDIQAAFLPAYWLFRRGGDDSGEPRVYNFLFSHMLEILYGIVIVLVALETKQQWQPVVWAGLALLSLFYAWPARPDLNRIRLYSVFLSWAAAFQLCFILGLEKSGWLSGTLVIALNILYLLLFSSKARLDDFSGKGESDLLSRFAVSLGKHRARWLFYPFFAAVALFILFRFNRNIITLMFVLESLMVFLLSLRFRENSFRFLSMAGIGGSLLRLIFFDLTNSGTVLRALVFIGMGVVMVVMNVIYSHARKE